MAAGKGISARVQAELDRGSVQRMMSDFERALAATGSEGGKKLGRAMDEQWKLEVARLKKQLADGLIDEKTFARMKREADLAFNKTLSAGMDKLRRDGKLTDAEFAKLAGRLKQVKQESDQVGGSFRSMLAGFAGGLAVSAMASIQNLFGRGLAAARDFLIGSSEAAAGTEDNIVRLAGQLERAGVRFSAVQGQIEAAARRTQQTTRFDDDAYIMALDKLVEGTNDYALSVQHMDTVLDLAAKRKIDVVQAAELVGRALRDEGVDLERFKIQVLEGETAIQAIARTFRGSAAQDAETFSGKVARVRNAWDSVKESFGLAINDFLLKSGIFTEVSTDLEGFADKAAEWWRANDEEVMQALRDLKEFAHELRNTANYALKPIIITIEFAAEFNKWLSRQPTWAQRLIGRVDAGAVSRAFVNTAPGGGFHIAAQAFERDFGGGPAETPILPAVAAQAPAGQRAPSAGPAAPARMTEEQIRRWQQIASMRRLTREETAALRREEAALSEQLRATATGSEKEVEIRQQQAAVQAALRNEIRGTTRDRRDADEQLLAHLGTISQARALTRAETERLISMEQRYAGVLASGTAGAREQAEATDRLQRARALLDGAVARDIQQLQERQRLAEDLAETDRATAAQVRLRASDLAVLLEREDQLRRALSDQNLERSRQIRYLQQLRDIQSMLPQVNTTVAATVQDPRATRGLRDLSGRTEGDRTAAARDASELSLLAELARYRVLNSEEARRAEGIEERIERRLQNQNLTIEERIELERQLATARDLTMDAFNVDNFFEALKMSAADAGEFVSEAMLRSFNLVFEGGASLREFLGGMWDGYVKGIGQAIAGEAKIRSSKAMVEALSAGAEALIMMAHGNAKGAALLSKAVPQKLLEAAKWAALGGGAAALGAGGGGGGGGADSATRLPHSGKDPGTDLARQTETTIYVRVEDSRDPFDPNRPQVQDWVVKAAQLGAQRH